MQLAFLLALMGAVAPVGETSKSFGPPILRPLHRTQYPNRTQTPSTPNEADGRSLGETLRRLQGPGQNDQPNGRSPDGALGPEIQFDTKGVEFGPWIRRFIVQVKRNWLIPFAAANANMKGHVVVTFNVHQDGSITDLSVAEASTVDAFNEAAQRALAASNPTGALPSDYPAEKAFFTVTFYYNESPPRLRTPSSGLDKLRAGDLNGAIAAFSERISQNPKDKTAYLNRGVAKQRQGNIEAAIVDFTQAITVDPDFSRAYASRGTAKKGIGDSTGARADLTQAIALAPNDPIAYERRAYLEVDTYDWEAALMDFRKVCELDTSSIRQKYARLRMWIIQARLGREDLATRELASASASWTSGNARDEWVATLAQFLAGHIAEGDFLDLATSGDPKTMKARVSEAYFYAGSTRLIHGEAATAVEYFRRTLQTGLTTFLEYDSARAELKHLGVPRIQWRPYLPGL